jgi:hypothetical protein
MRHKQPESFLRRILKRFSASNYCIAPCLWDPDFCWDRTPTPADKRRLGNIGRKAPRNGAEVLLPGPTLRPEKNPDRAAIDSEDTLAFSVLENIGPMIETVPLEQAADAYARIGESEATQHATKWMRRSEPSPNLTGEQNEYHS